MSYLLGIQEHYGFFPTLTFRFCFCICCTRLFVAAGFAVPPLTLLLVGFKGDSAPARETNVLEIALRAPPALPLPLLLPLLNPLEGGTSFVTFLRIGGLTLGESPPPIAPPMEVNGMSDAESLTPMACLLAFSCRLWTDRKCSRRSDHFISSRPSLDRAEDRLPDLHTLSTE